jgi:DNA modification methylase
MRVETIGAATLHLGDCNTVMLGLPSESVDAVVTSPPYDNLRSYGGHRWDFAETAFQLARIVKPGGVVVWIIADETIDGSETGTSLRQALYFKDKCGFNLHDTMIWNKGSFTGVGSVQVRYGPSTEFMFVLSKGKPATFNPIKDRRNIQARPMVKARKVRLPDGSILQKTHQTKEIGAYGIRFNCWDIAPEQSNTERVHPAQFPVKLAADHVASWTKPGDTVLDCFAGSGSTGVASVQLGRKFIGIEIHEPYFNGACERIDNAQRQERLIA